MKVEEIISSGLLESYVMGVTSSKETALIVDLCKKHPELLVEIERIEESLINYAQTISPQPDESIKKKIFDSLNGEVTSDKKLIKLSSPSNKQLRLYQVGMAASILLLITSIIYNTLLQQKLGKLNNELSELYAAKSYLAQEIKIQQTSINSINQRLQIVTKPGVKSITLNGMNSLDSKSAIVYWNSKTEEVYFNIAGLPDSPASKQYQLWAIVNGKPVDAGVIDMSSGDQIFQKMKSVKGAVAFAVTIEKTGGSVSPTLSTMCLLGNV